MSSEQDKNVVKGLFEWSQDSYWFTEVRRQFKSTGSATETLVVGAVPFTGDLFNNFYTVRVVLAGEGQGTVIGCNGDAPPFKIFCADPPAGEEENVCSAEIESNVPTSLFALAGMNSTFVSFFIDETPAGDGFTLEVNSLAGTVITIYAQFDLIHYTLSVTRAGSGSGIVVSSPAGISCGASCEAEYSVGIMVTLTAVPAMGSVFAGWSGDAEGTGVAVITMDSAKSVTATFDTI